MESLSLFSRALALIALSRLLLARRGTPATLRRLGKAHRGAPGVDPQRALRAVRRAAKVAGGECLPQAVALTALLHREGHEPVLVLGCRRYPNRTWTAHAWVELDKLTLEPVTALEHASLAYLKAADGWVPSQKRSF